MTDHAAQAATRAALKGESARASALDRHVAEIHRLGRRVVTDVIAIGKHLVECKRLVGHGNWLSWLEREFAWTEMTATRFINVFQMSKTTHVLDLDVPLGGLYLLAAPSTPQAARDEIANRDGRVPTAEVQEVIEKHKADDGAEESAAASKEDATGEEQPGQEHGDQEDAAPPEQPAPPEPEPAKTPKPARLSGATKRSIDDIWNAGSEVERECIKALVIEEFFATATGSEIFGRIVPGRLIDTMRAMLDLLGAEGMLGMMSPEFGKELRARVPTSKRNGKPYVATLNLSATRVSGADAGKTEAPVDAGAPSVQRPNIGES